MPPGPADIHNTMMKTKPFDDVLCPKKETSDFARRTERDTKFIVYGHSRGVFMRFGVVVVVLLHILLILLQ